MKVKYSPRYLINISSQNTWNDVRYAEKCGKAHYIKVACAHSQHHCDKSFSLLMDPINIVRYDVTYFISRFLLDQMSFQMVQQTNCRYVNSWNRQLHIKIRLQTAAKFLISN